MRIDITQDTPHYILKANECVLIPQKGSLPQRIIKTITYIIIFVIIFGSIIFGENLVAALSSLTKVMLFGLIVNLITNNKKVETPSPIELRFYADYLVLYREKCYLRKNAYRMEFEKIYYKDIKESIYKTNTKRINFYGVNESVYYMYKKNGELSERPSYHKTTDSIVYFYTNCDPTVDFVKEIEEHSPIKVEYMDA